MESKQLVPNWVKWIIGVSVGIAWFLIALSIVAPYFVDPSRRSVNDQLLQVILWAITTVFTIAGALLGLNWYQGERRHQEQVQEFERIKQTTQDTLDRMQNQIKDVVITMDAATRAIQKLQENAKKDSLFGIQDLMRAGSAESMVNAFIDRLDSLSERIKRDDPKIYVENPMMLDDLYNLSYDVGSIIHEIPTPAWGPLVERMKGMASEFGNDIPEVKTVLDRTIRKLSGS